MNRRAFLKLFAGTVAIATIPIPKFLMNPDTGRGIYKVPAGAKYLRVKMVGGGGGGAGIMDNQKLLEDAAIKSLDNYGHPEVLIMSEDAANVIFGKFGYSIVIRD